MKKLLVFLIALLILPLSSAVVDWTNGLVMYNPMDEGAGNTINDTFLRHNWTCDTVPCLWTTTNQKVGNAATRWLGNSGADGINITNAGNFNAYTWSIWINATPPFNKSDSVIISHGGFQSHLVVDISGRVDYTADEVLLSSNASIINVTAGGGFHHIVATLLPNNKSRLFIDGTFVGERVAAGLNNENTDFDLAKNADTHFAWFNGTLDEFGYWNRSLSIGEIMQLYNNGLGLGFNNVTLTGAFSIDGIETQSIQPSVTINASGSSVSSAVLYYNGSLRTETVSVTSLGSGIFNLTSAAFDTPLLGDTDDNLSLRNWNFIATLANGTVINSSVNVNLVNRLIFEFCNPNNNIAYINFTFKNETTAQERIKATIDSSWSYFMGSGIINKTLIFSNTTENFNYTFCTSPPHGTLFAAPTIIFDNSESDPRSYTPTTLTLTNTTTNVIQFLLPSSTAIPVTVQVLNVAGTPISGATVTLTRSGFSGSIETRVTGASGTVAFFVNPFVSYIITVEAQGFETFMATNIFVESQFTVTLGGESGAISDPTQGITYIIFPQINVLGNSTAYNFNFTVNASLANLDSFGFYITNASGTVFGSDTDTTASGGITSIVLNTGLNGTFVMQAFYEVNGTIQNITRVWVIRNEDFLTSWSITNFFNRLASYLNPTSGTPLFGISSFGVSVVVLTIIIGATGLITYNYDIRSPSIIGGIIFALVAIFDVRFNLITNPVGAIPHFVTILCGFVVLAIAWREYR